MSLYDRYIQRQTYLERVKAQLSNDVKKKIRKVDNQALKLSKDLGLSPSQVEIDRYNQSIKQLYTDFFTEHHSIMVDTSRRVVRNQINWLDRVLSNILPSLTLPNVDSLLSSVETTPYKNKTMAAWTRSLINDKVNRAVNIVRQEFESKTERAAELRRTLNVSNHNASTITKTYINHSTSITNNEVNDINNLTDTLIWVSVLDSRTSMICMVRSNKRYNAITKAPIGHSHSWGGGPGLIHFNCRSIAIPALDDIVTDLEPSYDEWLKQQPREFVEDTLGKQKASKFLDEGVALDRFAVPSGRELTISQLEQL